MLLGEYHLFYIHGEPWEHISTTDFVNFKEYPTAIPSGGENAQDKSIFTGSVIKRWYRVCHLDAMTLKKE